MNHINSLPEYDTAKESEQQIEENMWHQGKWMHACGKRRCGTAACFAGWTVMLQEEPTTEDERRTVRNMNISEKASSLLGLSASQKQQLFHRDNSKAKLRKIVDAICNCEL